MNRTTNSATILVKETNLKNWTEAFIQSGQKHQSETVFQDLVATVLRDLLMNNRSLLLHTDGRALRRVCLELLKDTEWGSFFADIETVRRANSPRAMQRRAKAFANLAQYINTASVERVALEAYGLHLNGTWNDGEHGVLYGIIKARCENTEWQGLLEILEQQETKQQKVEAYAAFIKLNL